MQTTIVISVTDGVISSGRTLLAKAIKDIKTGKYEITIKKYYKARSSSQNAFYWGIFLPALNEVLYQEGYAFASIEDLHEWCKETFNRGEVVNEHNGEVLSYAKSTKELKTIEYEEYMERIRIKIIDMFNANLPYPNDNV